MPPTLPCFRSPRGQCAAAAITISTSTSSSSSSDQSVTNTQIILSSSSSSESDQSLANTLVNLSSATFSAGGPPVVVVPDTPASRGGGGEARGGRGQERAAAPPGEARGGAPRHRRPPSPAHSAVAVRSSTLVTVASSANGSGDVATRGRTTAAPRRSPSPCSVLCVRAPGGGGGGGSSDDDEATSRPKKKYRKWAVQDECKILDTLAKLRRRNLGVAPQASVLLNGIRKDGGLLRRGVDATDIAEKVYKLKKKFVKTAARVAAGGRRRPRKFRDRVLYEASKEAWPDLVPGHGVAAAAVQI